MKPSQLKEDQRLPIKIGSVTYVFMRAYSHLDVNDIPIIKAQLKATGEAELEEGNTWNDTFWGSLSRQGPEQPWQDPHEDPQ